jgi:hypothetical protein
MQLWPVHTDSNTGVLRKPILAIPSRLRDIRSDALEAVRNALARDGDERQRLHYLWDPRDPDKLEEPEDQREHDLEVFYGDPEFKALLVRSRWKRLICLRQRASSYPYV